MGTPWAAFQKREEKENLTQYFQEQTLTHTTNCIHNALLTSFPFNWVDDIQ